MHRRAGKANLHRLFQVAVAVKGIDGVLEFIGGVLLCLSARPLGIVWWARLPNTSWRRSPMTAWS